MGYVITMCDSQNNQHFKKNKYYEIIKLLH
jgi:hypothetical protein